MSDFGFYFFGLVVMLVIGVVAYVLDKEWGDE